MLWGAGCNSLYCFKCFLEWFLPLTLSSDPVQGWVWRGPGSSSWSAQPPWLERWALLSRCGVFFASEPGRVLGHERLAVVSVASLGEMPACLVLGLRKVWNSFEVGTHLLYIFPVLWLWKVPTSRMGSFSTFNFTPVHLHRSGCFATLLVAAVSWLSYFPAPSAAAGAFPSISSSGFCSVLLRGTLSSECVQVGGRCGKGLPELLSATGKAALRQSGTAPRMISPCRKLALLGFKTSK